MKRCHCGSEMIPLFQSYACKAECDLPLSMRTKRPAPDAMPRANVSASFDVAKPAAPWVPAIGTWVRVTDVAFYGVTYKVNHCPYSNMWAGVDVRTGCLCQFPTGDLELWRPFVSERVFANGLHCFVSHVYASGSVIVIEPSGVYRPCAAADLEPAP